MSDWKKSEKRHNGKKTDIMEYADRADIESDKFQYVEQLKQG